MTVEPKIARVILTLKCKLHCPGCCNNFLDKLLPRKLGSLNELKPYKIICLTGGEPLLETEFKRTLGIAKRLKNAGHTVYLYSSETVYSNQFSELMKYVDGIHYTLHGSATAEDTERLLFFQIMLDSYVNKKSFRLYIDSAVKEKVSIWPNIWSRIEIKPWNDNGCPLPPNETLFTFLRDVK